MTSNALRRAFVAFHVVLGVTLLALSLLSLRAELQEEAPSTHFVLVAGAEALGAVMFLLPRTLRIGAVLLALTLLPALVMHATRGQFRGDLLVYLAGVLLVAVRGSSANPERREPPSAAAAT